MKCGDFIHSLEESHSGLKWTEIQKKIDTAMRELLEKVSGLFDE